MSPNEQSRCEVLLNQLIEAMGEMPSMTVPQFGEVQVTEDGLSVELNPGMVGAFVYEISVKCVGQNDEKGRRWVTR